MNFFSCFFLVASLIYNHEIGDGTMKVGTLLMIVGTESGIDIDPECIMRL